MVTSSRCLEIGLSQSHQQKRTDQSESMRSLDREAGLQDHRGKDIYGGKARIRWKHWGSSAGERTRNKLVSKSSSGRWLKWREKWDTQRLEWGWKAFSIKGQTVNISVFTAYSLASGSYKTRGSLPTLGLETHQDFKCCEPDIWNASNV